jgi:muramoyltetrapeptide carboxypeptidase
MDRRNFLASGTAGLASTIALGGITATATPAAASPVAATGSAAPSRRPVRPAPVPEGATVGLIAPAGPVSAQQFEQTETTMARLGFTHRYGPNARQQFGYLAGTDEQRVADLHWAFENDEIDVVWCIRGGYGTTRLLDRIDYGLIRSNPKPLVGFSDITALNQALLQRAGLVTFQGPVAAFPVTDQSLAAVKAKLLGASVDELHVFDPASVPDEPYAPAVIAAGRAQGTIVGGNEAVLVALAGTRWSPRYAGKIVIIEEIETVPYKVDRALTHLLAATDLSKAAGIAFGVFAATAPVPGVPSFTLIETLADRVGSLGIPVQYGLPFGHIAEQATIAHGQPGILDTTTQTLTVLDTAAEDSRTTSATPPTTVFTPRSSGRTVPEWALR